MRSSGKILFILILAIIFRFYDLSRSLTHDEIFTVVVHAYSPVWKILYFLPYWNNHFLHSLLLHFILKIGESEIIIRSLALISGILSVFLFFLIYKKILRESILFIALSLFALNLLNIGYSKTARGYTLGLLMILIFFYCFYKFLENRRRFLLYILPFTVFGACYTIIGNIFLFGILLLCLPRKKEYFFIRVCIIIGLFLTGMFLVNLQPSIWSHISNYNSLSLINRIKHILNIYRILNYGISGILTMILILTGMIYSRNEISPKNMYIIMAFLPLIGGIIMPSIPPRVYIFCTISNSIFVAYLIEKFLKNKSVYFIFLLTLWVGWMVYSHNIYSTVNIEYADWKKALAYFKKNISLNTVPIITATNRQLASICFSYYYEKENFRKYLIKHYKKNLTFIFQKLKKGKKLKLKFSLLILKDLWNIKNKSNYLEKWQKLFKNIKIERQKDFLCATLFRIEVEIPKMRVGKIDSFTSVVMLNGTRPSFKNNRIIIHDAPTKFIIYKKLDIPSRKFVSYFITEKSPRLGVIRGYFPDNIFYSGKNYYEFGLYVSCFPVKNFLTFIPIISGDSAIYIRIPVEKNTDTIWIISKNIKEKAIYFKIHSFFTTSIYIQDMKILYRL